MGIDDKGDRPNGPGWIAILGLIGLDYFSSLAYHPSVAYEAAGSIAPIATAVLALITVLGVLPVYAYIAARSPNGQGSWALLERLAPGWLGKFLILALLGFAATDFIVTRSVSAAGAAEHLLHNTAGRQFAERAAQAVESAIDRNARWTQWLPHWNRQLVATLFLSVVGSVFWLVFSKTNVRGVLRLAIVVSGAYLVLNVVVIGAGLAYLFDHGELLDAWLSGIRNGQWYRTHRIREIGDLSTVGALSLLAFPQLVIGLSGFELSLVVMPLMGLTKSNDNEARRARRIRQTWRSLAVASVAMGALLVGASLVTTILIPAAELAPNGAASHRALAYLAHAGELRSGDSATVLCRWFGDTFGAIYDIVSIVILCLAGASVMLGLRDLVPPALLRFGMELEWAHNVDAFLHVLNALNLATALWFGGSLSAQLGAYTTAVLALVASSAVIAALDVSSAKSIGKRRAIAAATAFIVVAIFFHLALGAMLVQQPDGLKIAGCFVVTTMLLSIFSRFARRLELRFDGFQYRDARAQFLWESLQASEFPVLAPHRPGGHSLFEKERRIRRLHRIPDAIPIVFVRTHLGDWSEFRHKPTIDVIEEEGRFVIEVTGCVSIAHTIAAVAIELSKAGRPPEVHFGWSDQNPISANLDFVLFGRGNVPLMVRALLAKAVPDAQRRPPIVVG